MMKKGILTILLGMSAMLLHAEGNSFAVIGDSTKTHVFTIGAELKTRGEYLHGALPDSGNMAAYISERTRLYFHYKQPYLEIQITPQHAGTWGTKGGGEFTLREAWAQADYKGAFLKLGRQTLAYDDERIIGSDDWSMTGAYHDCMKVGYEGFGHRVHVIGAYNQNDDHNLGGTYYKDGAQIYKNMQSLWYHYDAPRWFSASLLFINTGMQSVIDAKLDTTYYQQLIGTYLKFRYPGSTGWWLTWDASFYYQMGYTEYAIPLNAWTAATEARAQACEYLQLNTGYFILSGDDNYTVPPPGAVGLQVHDRDRSFNLLYGSHHQFYGAMDFFYLQGFYGGYSPGLQDWHLGATFLWKDQVDFTASYHALATAVRVKSAPSKFLGNELELSAGYRPFSWMSVSAGYTFMHGTETMKVLKRANDRNQSHWVYLQVIFTPTFLTVKF